VTGSERVLNGTEVHGHRQGTHEREQEEYKEVSRSSSEVCHKVENQIEHNSGPYQIVSLPCVGDVLGKQPGIPRTNLVREISNHGSCDNINRQIHSQERRTVYQLLQKMDGRRHISTASQQFPAERRVSKSVRRLDNLPIKYCDPRLTSNML
jgi:hypothetical protein